MEKEIRIRFHKKMLKHINLFFSAGKGRQTNDMNNRIREDILLLLLHPPEDYIIDNEFGKQWQTLSTKWNTFVKSLCKEEYDDIKINKVANRKRFDLEIDYLKNNQSIYKVLGEFKHNVKTISKLPQYFSASESKRYIPVSYADYFYENYLGNICQLANIEKVNKQTYLKHIYQHDHNVNEFFQKLREFENTIEHEKKKIVHESIKTYLETYAQQLDIESLKKDLYEQQNKTFILWDCHNFHVDKIEADELELEKIEKIKGNNTIVVTSKSGTKHHMLLRWRNHLGILFPAWQISLQR